MLSIGVLLVACSRLSACWITADFIVNFNPVVLLCIFLQALDVQRERKRFENQRFAVQRSAGRLAAVLSGSFFSYFLGAVTLDAIAVVLP